MYKRQGLRERGEAARAADALLNYWTGQTASSRGGPIDLQRWQQWYAEQFPDASPAELPADNQTDRWSYDELLTFIESAAGKSGNAVLGNHVYTKAQCATCHRFGNRGETIGPDLTTAAKRFQRKEILESVLFPSHVISDQYRAKTVITVTGKQYTGIVAAGAPGEVVILQQDGKKVVVEQEDVDETLPSRLSAMPEGLLDNLSLQDVTDLFTYMSETPRSATASKPEDD